MKNKLLVSLFVVVAASLAFTSCKPKSDAKDVCDDLVKASIHKSPRSLLILNGDVLAIKEYEFASASVGDNRVIYRELSFGNGAAQTKKVENLTYQYGAWDEHYTAYSMSFSPATPYASVWYRGNSFIAPDGLVFGGEGNANTARVEKWEKTLGTMLNTDWEAIFRDEFELDSVFRDSIYKHMSHGKIVRDTIKVFDHMDTLCADTTKLIYIALNRDSSHNNTGVYYQKETRAEYDSVAQAVKIIDQKESQYNFNWYFSEVSSDSKFKIILKDASTGEAKDTLDISKYKYETKVDTTTVPPTTKVTHEFLRGGLMYKRPAVNPMP